MAEQAICNLPRLAPRVQRRSTARTGERFKATAYVTTRTLRSYGIRVQVFRQTQRAGQWVDAPASASTNAELEDRVLARARELRSQQTASR